MSKGRLQKETENTINNENDGHYRQKSKSYLDIKTLNQDF